MAISGTGTGPFTITGTETTISYAGVRNNAGVATANAAWTSRASLVYGDLSAA